MNTKKIKAQQINTLLSTEQISAATYNPCRNSGDPKTMMEEAQSDQIINLKELDEATIGAMKYSSCELKPFSF